jgi:hypothetical protein
MGKSSRMLLNWACIALILAIIIILTIPKTTRDHYVSTSRNRNIPKTTGTVHTIRDAIGQWTGSQEDTGSQFTVRSDLTAALVLPENKNIMYGHIKFNSTTSYFTFLVNDAADHKPFRTRIQFRITPDSSSLVIRGKKLHRSQQDTSLTNLVSVSSPLSSLVGTTWQSEKQAAGRSQVQYKLVFSQEKINNIIPGSLPVAFNMLGTFIQNLDGVDQEMGKFAYSGSDESKLYWLQPDYPEAQISIDSQLNMLYTLGNISMKFFPA